jgi:predicted methyltransferase
MSSHFLAGAAGRVLIAFALMASIAAAAEESVRPGINQSYQDPDYASWVQRFETPGREVYDRREAIVAALAVKPGMAIADIGAGTGLFTRLFADKVGPAGTVYAVDISATFVRETVRRSHALAQQQVRGIVNTAHSVLLAPASIDIAFTCDTYHHFEYPDAMLASIHQALRPGGRLVVIDFRKEPGRSSSWVMSHVRAGATEVIREIEAAGFRLLRREEILETNYYLIFERKA